jgi:hypothetical protein
MPFTGSFGTASSIAVSEPLRYGRRRFRSDDPWEVRAVTDSPPRPGQGTRNSLLWVALAYLATRLPFLYHGGFPDGDQQHIALGILDGILGGRYFGGVRLYGEGFSFGYYAVHFALAPLYRMSPFMIFEVINLSGLVAGLIALLALHRFVRELWSPTAALVAAWWWTLTPGWWELTTFGHPSTIATSLFLAALACFAIFLTHTSRAASIALAASGLLYFLALTMRADYVLGAPLLLALPLVRPRPRAYVAALGIVLGATAAFYAAHQLLFAGPTRAFATTFTQRVAEVRALTLRVAVKEVVVWVLGSGPVLFAIGILGLARLLLRRGQRRTGVVLLAGIVPSIAYWLQVEGPFRHFLLPAFVLVIAGALAWNDLKIARRGSAAIALALAVIVIDQATAALLFPAVNARYPWTFRAVQGERRWSTRAPLGDWFHNHAAASRGVRQESAEARWLAYASPDSVLVLTPSSYRAEFEFLARFPRSYRYTRIDVSDTYVESLTLAAPGRTLFVISGDPRPLGEELAIERASGRVPSSARVFVPAAAEPAGAAYPLNGLEIVRPTRRGT